MDDVIVRCPVCSEGFLSIDQSEIEIAHFGKVMVSTFMCEKCGYRSTDVIPLENHPPRRHITIIDSPEKLSYRVIRSGSSIVRIPEIGGSIEPGAMSEGYVTNIEGILIRFRDILEHMQRDLQRNSPEGEVSESFRLSMDLKARMNKILEEYIFQDILTLVIEDPLGNSAIVSDDESQVKVENLTQDEIVDLLSYKKKE